MQNKHEWFTAYLKKNKKTSIIITNSNLTWDQPQLFSERGTKCVGQLKRRLCAVEGLMSQRRSGKLTMHTSLKPWGILLRTAAILLLLQQLHTEPLKQCADWIPQIISVTSWFCNPAVTLLYLYLMVSSCVSLSSVSAPARQRQTHVHLLNLLNTANLIDDGGRN